MMANKIIIKSPLQDCEYDPNTKTEDGISISRLNELLSLKKSQDTLINKLKFINNKNNAICPDGEEVINIIKARLADFTEEQIKNFTKEQVEEILTVNDKSVNLPIEDKKVESEYRRDFLVYLKNTTDLTIEIEKSLKGIDDAISEFDEEYKKICDEYGDMNKFMLTRMREALENPKVSDKDKEAIRNMLKYTEYGFDLTPIKKELIDIVNKNGINSTMYRYTKELADIIAKAHDYLSLKAPSRIEVPFHLFQDLEIKFLPDKYKPFRNLGIFLISRWIWYNREKLTKLDYVFITQLFYNIHAFNDKRLDEETQNKFKENLMSLLDIVIDNIPPEKMPKYEPKEK